MDFINNLKSTVAGDMEFVAAMRPRLILEQRRNLTAQEVETDTDGNISLSTRLFVTAMVSSSASFQRTSLFVRCQAEAIYSQLLWRAREHLGGSIWTFLAKRIPSEESVVDSYCNLMHRLIFGDLKHLPLEKMANFHAGPRHDEIVMEVSLVGLSSAKDKERGGLSEIIIGIQLSRVCKKDGGLFRVPFTDYNVYHNWKGETLNVQEMMNYGG